jgi:hypothetical protein
MVESFFSLIALEVIYNNGMKLIIFISGLKLFYII